MIKKLLLISTLLTSNAYAGNIATPCIFKEEYKSLYKLAKEVDAACGWSIEQVVRKSILNECKEKMEEAERMHQSPFFTNFDDLRIQLSPQNKEGLDLKENGETFCTNINEYNKILKARVTYLKNEINEVDSTKQFLLVDAQKKLKKKEESDKKYQAAVARQLELAKIRAEIDARNPVEYIPVSTKVVPELTRWNCIVKGLTSYQPTRKIISDEEKDLISASVSDCRRVP